MITEGKMKQMEEYQNKLMKQTESLQQKEQELMKV